MNPIYSELLERYNQTGKIGFVKPKSLDEALEMIEIISKFYDEEPVEEISLNSLVQEMENYL